MDLDHIPIEIEDWKGMFTRGFLDTTPPGYFTDSLNIKFTESDIATRDGLAILQVLSLGGATVVRAFAFKLLNANTRYIILDSTGSLWDSSVGSGIINDVTYLDFSMINYAGRAYITPHNRISGISGKSLLVYDPSVSASARLAAGTPPSGYVITAVQSATAGNIEAGTHLIGVVNISSSGFISAPALQVAVVSANGFKIDVGNIDSGPAGTVARGIVSTKAIQNYNGNINGYEYFMVPTANGGLIANNNNNETTALSFFDAELQTSVDYLFDNRSTIPAGLGLCEYKGRLVTWGFSADPHSVYLSKPYSPEEFDTVGGVITVDPFESHSPVTNCFVFRGSLIMCKRNRIYQTTDNGGDPSTWQVDLVDNGAGTECFGVSTVIDSKGQENDRAFIADRSGLLIFEGYVKRPEATWLIEDTWNRINKAKFNLIQVCTDPLKSCIYISLPLDSSATINYVLYGYYGGAIGPYGLDPKLIKWTLWQFEQPLISMMVDLDNTTFDSIFVYFSPGSIFIMKHDGTVHNDSAIPIAYSITTALYTAKSGWVNHFSALRLRCLGAGTVAITAYGEDDNNPVSLPSLVLAALPGKEYFIPFNYKNEKIKIKFSMSDFDSYFKITRLDIFTKPLWFGRPG